MGETNLSKATMLMTKKKENPGSTCSEQGQENRWEKKTEIRS